MVNKSHNFIKALKDDNGGWLNTSEAIALYLLGKFSDLFKAGCTQDGHIIQTLFHKTFSFQENEDLCNIPITIGDLSST